MALSVKLETEEQERLRALAELRDRSPHYLMREAIRQYLDREEARESFKREALDAWRDYAETGLHVTGSEVDEWLGTWGTSDEAKAPEWHD